MKKQLLHRAATGWQRRLLTLLAGTLLGALAQVQAQPTSLHFTVDANNAEWVNTDATIQFSSRPDFADITGRTLHKFSKTTRTIKYPDGNEQPAYLLDTTKPPSVKGWKKVYYRLTCPMLVNPVVEDSIDLETIDADWDTHYPRLNYTTMVVDLAMLTGKVPVELLPTIGIDGNAIPSCIYVEPDQGTAQACLHGLYGEVLTDGTRGNFTEERIYATPGQTIRYVTLPMATNSPNQQFSLLGIGQYIANYNFNTESIYLLHPDSLVVTGNSDVIQTNYEVEGRTYLLGVKDLNGKVASVDSYYMGQNFNCNYRCNSKEFTSNGQVMEGVRLTSLLRPETVTDDDGNMLYKFHAIPGKQVLYYNGAFGNPFTGNFEGLIYELHTTFAGEERVWADYSQFNRTNVRFKGAAAIQDIQVSLSTYSLSTPGGDSHYFEDITVMRGREYSSYPEGGDFCISMLCSPVFKYITVYPSVQISGNDVPLPAQTARFGEGEIVYDLTPYISSGIGTPQLDDTPQAIFSVDGRRQPKLQRGMNIVRRADGTVSKVLVK